MKLKTKTLNNGKVVIQKQFLLIFWKNVGHYYKKSNSFSTLFSSSYSSNEEAKEIIVQHTLKSNNKLYN